jgi:tetratricopeptide (TPR) repeat protein
MSRQYNCALAKRHRYFHFAANKHSNIFEGTKCCDTSTMLNNHSSGLPQTGDAQEIGQDATTSLWANKPRSWILKDLGGTDDYGLDFQAQISINQSVQNIFRIQLKGTKSPIRNREGTYFSIPLFASTLRYYDNIVEPILLVFCDLSVDLDDPAKCPLYYAWVRPELRRVEIEKVPLHQGKVSLRVPVGNLLIKTTDLHDEIRQANALANIGHALDVKVETDRPGMNFGDRVDMLQDVQRGLATRSFDLLDALAEPATDHWVEPKRGTLAWHLRETSRHLRTGKTDKCKTELAQAEKLLNRATPIEKAELHSLNGRLKLFDGDGQGACDDLWEATKFDNQPKYFAAWAESELKLRYQHGGGNNDFTDSADKVPGNHPSILGIKARLLAAENKYEESIALLNTFTGVESLSARAIVETMRSKSAEALQACIEGMAIENISDSSHQLFALLKARARFGLAMGNNGASMVDEFLPPAGLPGIDVDLLRQAWQDIQEAVGLLQDGGWTSNVEFIADIWAATASMLGKQGEIMPLIVAAATARLHLEGLQTSAETVAAQCGEFETALEINTRTPDSATKWLRRTAYFHELNRHRDCVDLFEKQVAQLDKRHQLFGIVLPMAIVSAKKIVKTDLADHWLTFFDSDPKLTPYKAVANYLLATDANKLVKSAALRELEAQYRALGKPKPIALLLFMELDPADDEQAAICIEVANDVRSTTTLSGGAAVHLGMALVTTKQWTKLLDLCQESGKQFEGATRLTAFEGLALDRLGRADDARRLLEGMINDGKNDSVALKTYINIMARGGFVNQAIKTAEKIFELASQDVQKRECILLLFNLEQIADPASPHLLELAVRMGELVDPTIESQEGVYLMLMLTGTFSGNALLSPEQIKTFHARSDAFFQRFPNSKMVRKGQFAKDATPAQLLKSIRDLVGLDDERIANQTKLENQLQAGTIPFPYAWRPRHILTNVHDVVHLWEITKRSGADDRKHHLQMMQIHWMPKPAATVRSRVPLFDLISLLVISDIGLFDLLFVYFPKIAIAKGTLQELSMLTQPFSGSPWFSKCKELQDRLKEHYSQILQPDSEPEGDDKLISPSGEEIKRLCASDEFVLYSDDVTFRIYCGGDDANEQGICTGDFLSGLEEIGTLTTAEVAQKLSMLCGWHVGLLIEFKYQMAIVPNALKAVENVVIGVDLLQRSPAFMSMATAMWDFRSEFAVGVLHVGSMVKAMIEDTELSASAIASLLGVWYVKAKLRSEAPHPPINILINIIQLAAAHNPKMNEHSVHRLWSVFLALVEFEHGNRMDEQKEREAIELMAQQCAKTDLEIRGTLVSNLSERLKQGLTSGTANADHFAKASVLAKVQLGLGKPST